ncbi:MAG: hypothetical protein KH366_15930 [Clostridiaceae bacterium]|nr:hypothetical protein [Clostridiaceae bacterium]
MTRITKTYEVNMLVIDEEDRTLDKNQGLLEYPWEGNVFQVENEEVWN